MKLLTFSAHCSFPNIINMKSKIKQDNIIPTSIAYCIQNPQILYLLDCYTTPQISSSLCCPSLSHSSTTNATTIKSHHHHRSPHKPQPLQATSHNTTKIRSTTISRPKLDQTHSLKKKKKKNQSGVVRLTSSTLGVVGFSSDQPP